MRVKALREQSSSCIDDLQEEAQAVINAKLLTNTKRLVRVYDSWVEKLWLRDFPS